MDEYWNEYNEFDEEVENLKASLKLSVKDEVKKELEQLRKENVDLREVKKNLDTLTREAEQNALAAKNRYERAEREAYQIRYSELIKMLEKPAYKVSRTNELVDKCDSCNPDRYRSYVTPLGRELREECTCKIYRNEYKLSEVWVTTVAKSSRNATEEICWFDVSGDDEYRRSSNKIWKDEPYDEISSYYWIFRTEEDANKYIDYLKLKVEL